MVVTLQESPPPNGYIPQCYPHDHVGVIAACDVINVVKQAIAKGEVIVTDSALLLDEKKNYCIYRVPVMKDGKYEVMRDTSGLPVNLCLKIQIMKCGKGLLARELEKKRLRPETSSLIYVPPWIFAKLNIPPPPEESKKLIIDAREFEKLTGLLESYSNVVYVKNLSGTNRAETHPLEGEDRVDYPHPQPVLFHASGAAG